MQKTVQVVIDILKDDYKKLFTKAQTYLFEKDYLEDIADMVKNGTVLEPHGRLGDLDYLYKKFEANGCKDSNVYRLIKDEPTILEANKAESEE